MSYYVTMTHDNVEEVVSVHLKDDLVKVHDYIVKQFGSMTFTINENGSIKATPLGETEVFYTIIKEDK